MKSYILNYEEWQDINEFDVGTLFGKKTDFNDGWIYKGRKYKKNWFEILPTHQHKFGFDVIISENDKGNHVMEIIPKAEGDFLGTDLKYIIPMVVDIISYLKKSGVAVHNMKIYIDGVELGEKIKDKFKEFMKRTMDSLANINLTNSGGLEIKF